MYRILDIEQSITIIIALIGWFLAIYQFYSDKSAKKQYATLNMKFEAYSRCIKKLEEINSAANKEIASFLSLGENMKNFFFGNPEEIESSVNSICSDLVNMLINSTDRIVMLKQELQSTLLVASNDVCIIINQLIVLTEEFETEMRQCISTISHDDPMSFMNLKNITENTKWIQYKQKQEELLLLMRQELQIK